MFDAARYFKMSGARLACACILVLLVASDLSAGVRVNLRDFSWQRPRLPNLSPVAEIDEGRAEFKGHVRRLLRTDCDLDCQVQKDRQPLSMEDIENDMSFETLDVYRQVRIKTLVNVSEVSDEMLRLDMNSTAQAERNAMDRLPRRSKRAIFGYDTRFNLPTKKFSTMFPFSTAVKLSTGCAGVMVSPNHVLTSAHCIHDGKKYLKGVKRLRVGRMIEKVLKKRGKKKGRKGKKGKKGKKNRKRSHTSSANAVNEQANLVRTRRDAPKVIQKFKWTRARKTHIPHSWIKSKQQRNTDLMVEYDYAVIELKRPLGSDFMKLGISPVKERLPRNQRIHFTAFEPTKTPTLIYRYCAVEEQSADMMYHYCDAQKGSSGAGIYIRLYDSDTGHWDRRVVGIFSGHQWVDMGQEVPPKEYNTGVRITPLKFAQICFWTTGDYGQCRDG
ncbi:inactive serine protease 35-like [Clavelina lepadiformis]|uniref:Peptidase S1 domain-containing protein n=1 Tax=Clavelina lepadiformis TaxID=159417 RepID=A0ABP0F0U6_CLALP